MPEKLGMAGRKEHRISIPGGSVGPEWNFGEWSGEMERKMTSAVPTDWTSPLVDKSDPKICKLTVLKMISQQKPETVERLSQPSVVTIGPFHRQQEGMSISDNEKWVIVFLTNMLHNLDLASSLRKMKDQVKKARNSYSNLDASESSDFKDDKIFAEMLLLDSYLIFFTLTIQLRKGLTHYTLTPLTPKFIEEPLKLFQYDSFKFFDIIFNKDDIALDLLILDNQIPFFVIEELFKELESKKPLHEYALEFFETIHPSSARHCKDQNISPHPEFLHLLDLFHWSRVPQNKYINLISPSPQQPDSIGRAGHIPKAVERKERATATEKNKSLPLDPIDWARHTPSAVELRESATMLEKKTSDSSLDITFRGRRFTPVIRVLDIPELHIRDYSSLIFHNLIAFEIQSPGRSRCTMAFSALMQNLLQREKDVKLLWQRGILASSSIQDRQLVDLFARLSRLTANHQMPSDLSTICHQVISHHNRPVSRFWGGVIVRYFPSPLVTLTVFGAILLFIPTILQTIYAML